MLMIKNFVLSKLYEVINGNLLVLMVNCLSGNNFKNHEKLKLKTNSEKLIGDSSSYSELILLLPLYFN